MYKAAVVTVSDRSFAGERADESGRVIEAMLAESGYELLPSVLVPDDADIIKATLIKLCDTDKVELIVTTGGTGFAPRDVTPEATSEVCAKLAPGLSEAMRAKSLLITPHAMLSRGVCGIRGNSLIINLPGSPKAARENMETVLPALPHALKLLRGERADG